MKKTVEQEENEGFIRGIHDIPSDRELSEMSFVELVSELSSAEKDSPKFKILERELKKHLARDQAKINRTNVILGAFIGLIGVLVGSYIQSTPFCKEAPSINAAQQMINKNVPVKPLTAETVPSAQQIIYPESQILLKKIQ